MKLLLIGCGNLGSSLLKAWSQEHLNSEILVVQPSLSSQNFYKDSDFISFVSNEIGIPKDFIPDVTVLAIKPQQLKIVAPNYKEYFKNSLVISLLAGTTIQDLTEHTQTHRVVRIMPNIAMKIKESVNLTYAHKEIALQDKEFVNQLLHVSGEMIWLSSETLIDLLTPLSGSGPAYFFLLAEILTQLTIKSGVEELTARRLIQKTFLGSALISSNNLNYPELIQSVTSKGGVTEAALKTLKPILTQGMDEAFHAAIQRLNELSS